MRHSLGVLIGKTEDPDRREKIVEIANDMLFTELLDVSIVIFIPETDGRIYLNSISDVTNLRIK